MTFSDDLTATVKFEDADKTIEKKHLVKNLFRSGRDISRPDARVRIVAKEGIFQKYDGQLGFISPSSDEDISGKNNISVKLDTMSYSAEEIKFPKAHVESAFFAGISRGGRRI